MKRILFAAVAATLIAGPALAQTPIKPGTPSILTWQGDFQATGYRTIEKIYKTHTIRRGTKVASGASRQTAGPPSRWPSP